MNSAIIVAAGRGSRMNSAVSKQYLEIGGKAVLYWTMKAFLSHEKIDEIVVLIGEGERDLYENAVQRHMDFAKPVRVAAGGAERTDSVRKGLELVDQRTEYVLIHDGARPLVRAEDIDAVLDGLRDYDACITGVYVKDTIKILDKSGIIVDTPIRSRVFAAHTPQGFKRETLTAAYEKLEEEKSGLILTDESMVMEKTGHEVKTVIGSYENIKITTSEDMDLAEKILAKRLRMQEGSYEDWDWV